MKSTAVVSLDALGQKSVSVPQKSSCSCAVMGIYQMWVWGASLGQAEISFKPDYGRNGDPSELLLSSPRTFRAASQEQPNASLALRVLPQTMLQDTTSFHKHRDAVLFPGDSLLSPPHSVLLKKLIHPLSDKAHLPAKIHI